MTPVDFFEGAHTSYILSDGAIIYLNNSSWRKSRFIIDINGKKGPNKWGYDVFPINRWYNVSRRQTKLSDIVCPVYEKGGRRIKNVLLNNWDINNSAFSE